MKYTWLGWCNLRILPINTSIDGITIHLIDKFINYKVYAKGYYLNIDYDSIDSVKSILENIIKQKDLYCTFDKKLQSEIIKNDKITTNACILFLNIKYKNSFKRVKDIMEYLHINTSVIALIFICDNFLYENEIYNPHEELNFTIIKPTILTYIISNDLIEPYKKKKFNEYIFELYWGIDNKTDIVHIDYHLDYGKYFNYTFFLYMKKFFLYMKDNLSYKIDFTIHNNFNIESRFCFIKDSSYCISKPDYLNSNIVRHIVEQQVRSQCIYEITLDDQKYDENVTYYDPTSGEIKQIKDENNNEHNILFSEKFIKYINELFRDSVNDIKCSSSKKNTIKCAKNMFDRLNIPMEDVNNCFMNNFHTYIKKMIKQKFYVYSLAINGNVYKMKLNKDISIKLICSAFRVLPKYCKDYLKNRDLENNNTYKISKSTYFFIIFTFSLHIIGAYINNKIPYLKRIVNNMKQK